MVQEQVDIGIITIREDEYEAMEQRLPQIKFQDGTSGQTYGICQVQTKTGKSCKVAITRCSEQGTAVSQQVSSDMIRDMDPQILLVVGIAGGVPSNDFTLGDVIISSRIHDFNVNAIKQGDITFDVRGGIHPRVSKITAGLPMRKNSMSGWNEQNSIGIARPSLNPAKAIVYGDDKWRQDVIDSLKSHFGKSVSLARLPLAKTGSIASSNTLMKDTDIPTTWLASARGILAIEMESAGVLQAAQQTNIQYPVMAIRGISDIVGLKREDQWTKYACQTAAAFTYAFIIEGIIVPREPATIINNAAKVSSSITQKSVQQVQPQILADGKAPIEVFISYSEDDEKFKNQLDKHLITLVRRNIIHSWDMRQIGPGQDWGQEINHHINIAQIILLIVSPSYLVSNQLYENEMPQAMARHELDNVCVIPIIVRPVDLDEIIFQKLQSLPRNLKPIDGWRNADEAWHEVAIEIRRVCDEIRKIPGKH